MDFLQPSNSNTYYAPGNPDSWKVIIADDDPDVLSVTHLILRNLRYHGRKLQLIDAHSESDAIRQMREHPDAALIILDMIMENDDSGIRVIKHIRNEVNNEKIQIVLRTGQPGDFPEEELIIEHSINDYKSKTELTKPKLITTVVASLRAYETLLSLEELNKNLDKKVSERTQELEEQKKELQNAKDHLEKLNKTKTRFFSIISHDLRGPMSVLIGFNVLIRDHLKRTYNIQNDFKLDEITGYLEKTANQLLQLLDGLLKWALKEEGMMPYHPTNIELRGAVEEIIEVIRPQAIAKKIQINSFFDDEEVYIWADKNSLMTILRNLTSNAMKFTPEKGNITIEVEKLDKKVRIDVIDTGIGISEEKMEYLFDVNESKVSKGTKGEKGTGLGLNLVKDFVKMNGGEITVESRVGKGSKFSVFLPTESSSN